MTPGKTYAVAKYEFMNTVKKKSFILTTLLLPFLMVVPVFLSTTFLPDMVKGENQSIGYVDESGMLRESAGFVAYSNLGDAKAALLKGEVNSFFILQEDYLSSGNITVYTLGSLKDSLQSGSIDPFIEENLLEYANVSDEIMKRIITSPARTTITLDDEGNVEKGDEDITKFIIPFALSVILLLSIMMSSSFLMQGIGEEKENRTGELLLSSISAQQLLKGKIIGYGVVGLLQIGVWMAMALAAVSISPYAALLSGVRFTWILALGIAYFFLGYALFSVSIACASAIAPTAREAQQTASLFTMTAALPMFFSQFIILAPDSEIATALTLFPYTAPVVTMMRIAITQVPPMEIIASMSIMLATITAAMKMAGKIFRMGMLMQGKKATVREIIATVREK